MGRKQIDIAYRRERVKRRYARGETVSEIARQLETTEHAVRSDLKYIGSIAAKRLADPAKHRETIALMLARCEEMYRASWEALVASQGESVETRVTSEIDEIEEEYEENGQTKTRKKQIPGKPKSTLIRKKQAGDPRWMERAGWAWQKMCEIQGLLNNDKMKPDQAIAAPTGETGVVLFLPKNGRDPHLQTNTPEKKNETKEK